MSDNAQAPIDEIQKEVYERMGTIYEENPPGRENVNQVISDNYRALVNGMLDDGYNAFGVSQSCNDAMEELAGGLIVKRDEETE